VSYKEEYNDCLKYIDEYWKKIIFKPSRIKLKYRYINIPTFIKDRKNSPKSLYVPNTYFVPNLGAQKRICYWDSYFMFKGLLGTKRQGIMKKMVNNLVFLYNTYQIIPNFNAPASINRSQPPFLTSMILDAYLTPLITHRNHKYHTGLSSVIYKTLYDRWFNRSIKAAKSEYETVWIDKDNYYNHHVKGYSLSRYGDRDIGYAHSSELESGWDMTSRFYNRCDQFLPIDLNSYLYKYETDFALIARMQGNKKDEEFWIDKAMVRKNEMNQYMWDKDEKFFFDYGFAFNRISQFYSLASFTPLWAGIATESQAKEMVKKLGKFETDYGLTISSKESLARPIDISKVQRRYHPAINEIILPKQWDYPNIWSPLEYLTVIGLLKYGYTNEAQRIMQKSIKAHASAFRKFGTFFEKLDGTTGESGKGALYGDQDGFGWTNAIFYRYIQILDSLESTDSIYKSPKPSNPPFELSILY
jgi:alpha,alpha-trehalase